MNQEEIAITNDDYKTENFRNVVIDAQQRRREYHRKYYHDHVDLVAERTRKQKFYATHRDEILAKAKARYQKKKLIENGIPEQIKTTIN